MFGFCIGSSSVEFDYVEVIKIPFMQHKNGTLTLISTLASKSKSRICLVQIFIWNIINIRIELLHWTNQWKPQRKRHSSITFSLTHGIGPKVKFDRVHWNIVKTSFVFINNAILHTVISLECFRNIISQSMLLLCHVLFGIIQCNTVWETHWFSY